MHGDMLTCVLYLYMILEWNYLHATLRIRVTLINFNSVEPHCDMLQFIADRDKVANLITIALHFQLEIYLAGRLEKVVFFLFFFCRNFSHSFCLTNFFFLSWTLC